MLSRISSFSGPISKVFKIIISNTIDDFNYLNFSSTDGLSLVSTSGISNNWIYITNTNTSEIGNVYRSTAIKYNRSFSVEWKFNCTGGNGADGFCIQWNETKNQNGEKGDRVSRLESAINAISFLTHSNKRVEWWEYKIRRSNINEQTQKLAHPGFRQNVYYWFDYDHSAKTGKVYYSTTNKKPASAQHSYTDFKFDSKDYHIGFGAATGNANDYHILKSFKLTFS